jgi:hypothetical protein
MPRTDPIAPVHNPFSSLLLSSARLFLPQYDHCEFIRYPRLIAHNVYFIMSTATNSTRMFVEGHFYVIGAGRINM